MGLGTVFFSHTIAEIAALSAGCWQPSTQVILAPASCCLSFPPLYKDTGRKMLILSVRRTCWHIWGLSVLRFAWFSVAYLPATRTSREFWGVGGLCPFSWCTRTNSSSLLRVIRFLKGPCLRNTTLHKLLMLFSHGLRDRLPALEYISHLPVQMLMWWIQQQNIWNMTHFKVVLVKYCIYVVATNKIWTLQSQLKMFKYVYIYIYIYVQKLNNNK